MWGRVPALAAIVVTLAGCSSSGGSAPSGTATGSPAPASTAVSSSSSTPSSSDTGPPSTASTARPSDTPAPRPGQVRTRLLRSGDLGSGVIATSQVDANFPQPCGQHRSIDAGHRPAASAQVAFRTTTTRVLVSERVTYYDDVVSAGQVVTSLDRDLSCRTGTIAGRRVTVSAEPALPASVAAGLDASRARRLDSSTATSMLVVMRTGKAVAQLSVTSLTGGPGAAVVDPIMAAAARRLASG